MTGTLPPPEFSHRVDLREISDRPVALSANEAERAALATRFDLTSIGRLEAEVTLEQKGDEVQVQGKLSADYVQPCAVTGEDLPVSLDEQIAFRFVPERASATPDEEVELEDEDLDEIFYSGTAFDLGEAVAQSLALAINPYLTGPDADTFREMHELGEKAPDGPLQQALKGLKKD